MVSECSTSDLPIRKTTVACSCLHNGDAAHHLQHKASNIPKHFWLKQDTDKTNHANKIDFDHQIAEKVKSLPAKCHPIPILMDITVKRRLSPELFQRLAQMHLIQLSNLLHSRHKLQSLLHNGQLVVEYADTLFGISVQEPKQADTEMNNERYKEAYQQASIEGLYERIRNVSRRHSCWWGARTLVHKWISTSYLQSAFPEVIADLLLAVILDGSVENFSQIKSDVKLKELLPPSSLESAFIRFLYHLSFSDFDKSIYVLDKTECHNLQSVVTLFKIPKSRNELPLITVITPHDQTVSSFTKSLSDQGALQRIINCARHSLQSILRKASARSAHKLDELFETLHKTCLETYDAVIYLKPLIELQKSKENQPVDSSTNVFASLSSFDGVQSLLVELESAFQIEDNVMFHYNPETHNIGVKLLKQFPNGDNVDLKSLMEDIMIIGRGIVRDVCPVQSDENMISVE